MSRHVDIYSNGICYCSVCAPIAMPVGEVEELTNLQNPTGTKSKWMLSDDEKFRTGEQNPHPCDQVDSCQHWLMVC